MDSLLYLLMLLIPLAAQVLVSSSYKKNKKIKNSYNCTGFDVARKILDRNGLKDVYIVKINGNLTDHYDPSRKTVRLSSEVYDGESIASLAIAAHECGHAIQDKESYFFLKVRSAIFPIVNLGTKLSYILILIGYFAEALDIVYLGIAMVGLGLLFQLVTLPTEFNASRRAIDEMKHCDFDKDIPKSKMMLFCAALTYVAGVLSSCLEIIRLIFIFGDRD